MSINLAKNKDALAAAWHGVVDDKSSTNWAVFGYEGQTNNLKVVGTGNGGLEEMIDRLNSSQIMYAFCRVIDTKTSLPKCLLINWQGEGTPIVRKGTCANHIRDVEKLLKGAHITITARSEDDVEVDAIMEKLARATASTFKFNEPRGENDAQAGPVGTTYRRVIPEQEINAIERDQFWQKEEIEEKKRLEQERAKTEQERERLEREVRAREEKEAALREQKVTAKENTIARHKMAEIRAEKANNARNELATSQHHGNDFEDDHKSRSEELRRQRSKETQELIAQRTINARAVFEQNSAAGQMKSSAQQPIMQKSNHVEAAKKAFEEGQQKEDTNNTVPDEATVEEDEAWPAEVVINSTPATPITPTTPTIPTIPAIPAIPAVPATPVTAVTPVTPAAPATPAPATAPAPAVQSQVIEKKEAEPQEQTEPQVTKEAVTDNELHNQIDGTYLYFDPNNEGMKARALYDYQAADDTEITFDPGDIITHIYTIDEGWWQGLGPDGTYGLFPANYVEVIDYNTS